MTLPLVMESSETVLTLTEDLDPVPNLSCAGRGVSVSGYMVDIQEEVAVPICCSSLPGVCVNWEIGASKVHGERGTVTVEWEMKLAEPGQAAENRNMSLTSSAVCDSSR